MRESHPRASDDKTRQTGAGFWKEQHDQEFKDASLALGRENRLRAAFQAEEPYSVVQRSHYVSGEPQTSHETSEMKTHVRR